MAAIRYLKIFFALWSSLVVGIAGFNWWIDPYDMFPSPHARGINQQKPEANTRQRLSKAYGVSRARPEVLILGSSRGLAIADHHEVWEGKHVYNLALAGTTTYELFRYLQHANADGTVREIIWGLDWFGYGDGVGAPEFVDARLRADADGAVRPFNNAQYLRDIMPSLWSLDAIGASDETIKAQPLPGESVAEWAARRDRERVARKGGNGAMFREFETHVVTADLFRPFTPSRTVGHDGPGTKTWRAILRYAYAHGIDARFFISPEHARLLEIWRDTGRWPEIELWQRELVRVLAEEARAAGKPPFPLWDFSGYNTVTMETVPPPGGDQPPMRWYWEDSHYTEAVAYVMIDRMYGYRTPARPAYGDFGVLVTPESMDRHWVELQAARAVYAARFGDDVKIIQATVDAAAEFYRRP